ncbi:TldD/PmbA family protein [Sulfitobacter donghicola]|uniref:Modulator protein n=1 Tax=Sulfitobacter donghicola DSW-25 = KCTC 12864 = JCM 14565 TaxID=1300350 RepID=A0A073ILI5_9RHOB|nr:TldD/PmbA family protein [Sulfitobacter donghicola]KEJ90440.1 modulator protein [Sulfitobacter donghicola DSW-25 = KCTC 12864 = JCM 14565]KIN67672.1 Modulator of DNA gyrase protein [Sulfitobacter donghicola DSW-25 = KCTC 12864 = JCM 14565]
MTQALDALTAQMLDAAKSAGADNADAMAVRGTSLSVDVRAGALEEAQREEGTDIGLRVFVGQRSAIVSASDTSSRTLSEMAERAVAMAKEAPENPYAGLAAKDQIVQDWDASTLELFDPTDEPAPAALQQDAAEAEAAALEIEGITQVQSASAGYGAREVFLAGSNGFSGGYQRSDRGLSCVAIAGTGTGMERDYDGDSRIFQSDLRSASEIGRSAAERALQRLDARKPPTGSFPVLFDERVSTTLIGHLLGAINGSAITRGASFLRDAMDTQVLPKGLSLIEDPHRPRITGSRPFDGEFLPTQKRAIIEDGILKSWTLDLATGRQLDLPSTGNAARGTGSGPSPNPWNMALTQGTSSREDLIRDMGTGLLVTSMIGSTINPNTGDYSRGAAGLWVENGEVTHAINECTIAGNLRDMLLAMIPANDARTHLSRVVPSLLVPGMTIAGN